jgi:hypothetical protein
MPIARDAALPISQERPGRPRAAAYKAKIARTADSTTEQ